VDDKKELPDNQKLTVKRLGGGARVLENYGNKWAHFQTQFFQSNSQPYYALLSPDGKTVLNPPVGYTPHEENYKIFLDCGLEAFSNLNLSEPK
jgi:thiol:disulfide interchange protein DsbD